MAIKKANELVQVLFLEDHLLEFFLKHFVDVPDKVSQLLVFLQALQNVHSEKMS